ncbi:MAG: aminotransferase class IV [Bdellovibrionaceae bacterium]|nr:aminotransferase class IV [Pseudobdellovibrionaceae bacterium]
MTSPLFIIDTFRMTQMENPLLSFHIQRTFEAIQLLKSTITLKEVAKLYKPFQIANSKPDQKCRLVIDPFTLSLIKSEITLIDLLSPEIKLELATHRQQVPGLGLQNYKTSDRKYWDDNLSLKWPGTDDIIGINSNDQMTETSRFNLFIKMQDLVFTPSLNSGCVNGCLRRSALKTGFIQINQKSYALIEKDFYVDELVNCEIYVGNSLRGITKATLAMS